MGVKDLHTKLIGRPQHEFKNKKHQHHLSDLDGTVGIDISTLLYQSLQTPLGSAVFDIDGPKVPLYHAFQDVTSNLLTLLEKHKLDIILCFDNKGHLLEAKTSYWRNGVSYETAYRYYYIFETKWQQQFIDVMCEVSRMIELTITLDYYI